MKIVNLQVGPIQTNCYLIISEQKNIAVVDPGDWGKQILKAIEEQGGQVAYILLTHGHYDHIGAVNEIKEQFHQAVIAVGDADAPMLTDPSKSLARSKDGRYLINPDKLLHDGDEIKMDELTFFVYETPGHSLGGIVYRCEDALFTGDTLFAGDVGRTDLYGGSYPQIMQSVARLGRLEGNFHVLPGHGPFSTLDQERKINQYMRKALNDDYN